MPYVIVPKDFSKVARKVAMGLTARQLISIAIAGVVGLPIYFLIEPLIGELALYIIVLFLVPIFLAGFYKSKDGRKLEKIVKNFIHVRFKKPRTRPYQTQNIYQNIAILKQIQEVIDLADANNEGETNRSLRKASKKAKKTNRKASKVRKAK